VIALLWLGMMFFLMLGAIFVILNEPKIEPSFRTILLLSVGLLIYVNFGAPFIGQLLRLVISRQREFLADADGALLTRNPEGLARALAKISAANTPPMKVGGATAHLYFASPLSSDAPWWDRLFNSHPPIEERIDLLARMGSGLPPSVLREAEEAGARFEYSISHGSEAKEAKVQSGNSDVHGASIYDHIATNRLKTLLPLALFAFVLWSVASWLLTPFISFPGSLNAIIVIAIAIGASYLQYLYASNLVLWITGAEPIGKGKLWETVEKLRIDASLPEPRVCMVESAVPNAFTVGLNPERALLVVSRGLLQLVDQKELEGVLAHELSHIKNNDIRLNTTVAALAVTLRLMLVMMGILLIFFSIFGKSLFSHFPIDLSVSELLGPLYSSIGGTLIKGVLAIWISSLVISREQDYSADAGAVRLTQNPQDLAQALEKISSPRNLSMKGEGGIDPLDFAESLSQDKSWWNGLFRGATAHLSIVDPLPQDAPWWDRIFRTHPPIEDRIAQLVTPEVNVGVKI
jgi:heat shock protein HtpX